MTPNLVDVVKTAVNRATGSLRVCMPGKIESFDPVTQTASVKPQVQQQYEDASGALVSESLPVVPNTPVVFPFNRGGLTVPVAAGDSCLLVFADRSIDGWLESGTEQRDSQQREHHLTDAIAIIGLHHSNNQIADFDNARVVLGQDGGVKVAVSATEVNLGVGHNGIGTNAALLGTTYTSDESAMLQRAASSLDVANGQLQGIGTALNVVIPGTGALFNSLGATFATMAGTFRTFAAAQSSRLSTKVKLD